MSAPIKFGIKISVDGSKEAVGRIDEVTASTSKMGQTAEDVAQAMATSQRQVGNTTAQLALAQAKANAGLLEADKQVKNVGISAKQTAAALRQMPAQLTDIFTSLAGGQNPLLVLIQQGGQIKDSFGGLGNMFDTLGGQVKNFFTGIAGVNSSAADIAEIRVALNGVAQVQEAVADSSKQASEGLSDVADSANTATEAAANARTAMTGMRGASVSMIAGIAAAVTAVVALGIAYFQGQKEAQEYARALIMSGNAAGTTSSQMADMARNISRTIGTQGQAAAALAEMAGSGLVAAQNLRYFSQIAMQMEDAIGRSVSETVSDFAKLGKAPVEASEQLNETYRYLTARVYEQIRALQEQGREEDAAAVAQKTYADAFDQRTKEITANLGLMERGWNSVADAAKKGWDAFLDVGRQETLNEKLKSVGVQIAAMKKQIEVSGTSGKASLGSATNFDQDLEALRAQQAYLQENARLESRMATIEGERAVIQAAGIKAIAAVAKANEKALTDQEKMAKALKDYRDELEKIRAANPNSALLDPDLITKTEKSIRDSFSKKSGAKEFNDELERLNALLGKTNGLSQSFYKDWDLLASAYKKGAISLGDLTAAQGILLSQQPIVREGLEAERKAREALAAAAEKMLDTGSREIKSLEDQIAKHREHNATIGLSAIQTAELEASKFDLAAAADEELAANMRNAAMYAGDLHDAYLQHADDLKRLAKLKRESAALTRSGATKQAAHDAAEEAAKEWKRSFDDVSRSLTDSIMRGGKNAGEYLKDYFRTLVLRPIVQMLVNPIAGAVTGALTGGATGSGGLLGSISQGSSLIQAGQTLWSGFSGGMTSSMGGIVASMGSTFGSSALSSFGAGMQGASLASGLAGPTTAGASGAMGAGAMFAKSIPIIGWIVAGMMKNASWFDQGWNPANGTISNFGKLVGSPTLIPDKLLRSIGVSDRTAAILTGSALFSRAFGRKNPEIENFGVQGDFTSNGFVGNEYANIIEKGGWFRSDKRYTRTQGIDEGLFDTLNTGFAGLMAATKGFGSTLGIEASVIDGYTKSIKINLSRDAAQSQEIIAKLFSEMADELALRAAPNILDFAQSGETAATTLQRLSNSITATNAWLSMLKQRLFQVSLAGGDAASKLADAFGGLDNLSNASAAFYQTYYSDGERAARSLDDMKAALASVNLAMPATKDELRKMAASLDLNTESGRQAYAVLLSIAPEFAAVADVTSQLAKKTAADLVSAYTANGALVPALAAVSNSTGALKSGLGVASSGIGDMTKVAIAAGNTFVPAFGSVLTSANVLGQGAGALTAAFNATEAKAASLTSGSSLLAPILGKVFDATGALTVGLGVASGGINGMTNAAVTAGNTVVPAFGGVLTSANMLGQGTEVLATALNATETQAGALTAGLGVASGRIDAMTSAAAAAGNTAGNISLLFLDARSGLLSFNAAGGGTTQMLTDAQRASLALSDQIATLRYNAQNTSIDISGLNQALANVDTQTFIETISLVVDSLANRIKDVIGNIADERSTVREAAQQIINPTVMSKSAILGSIASIDTALPSNTALVASLDKLNAATAQQAALDANKTSVISTYAPSVDSNLETYQKSRAQSQESLNYFKSLLSTYDKSSSYKTVAENFDAGVKFRATGYYTYDAQTAQNNAAYAAYSKQFDTARTALAKYTELSAAYADKLAAIATQQTTVTSSINAATAQAKQAQLDYAAALQNFAIDASKSVSKLGKLREETLKYYDAQKQLATLMSSSAASLRQTVADYKYSQLTPQQQFDNLQTQFSTAYALALSTNGETLAGYGDKLNGLLNPLLEKAREVYGSDTAYNSFASTAIARAEAIASRLETLAPTNYAADSLAMLGQIDATLAALDDSSRSAEKLIVDAINASRDQTVGGLRAVVAALTGQTIPAFATGGDHMGGWRIVGENGPELEATGPARIFNAAQTRSLLSGGSNAELVAEMRAMRDEIAYLRIEARATASNTGKMSRRLDRIEQDGLLVRTESDTPLDTKVVA